MQEHTVGDLPVDQNTVCLLHYYIFVQWSLCLSLIKAAKMKATIGSQGIGDGQFIYSSIQLIENGHRIQLQSDLWGPFLMVRKKESRSILLLFYQEGSPHSQATPRFCLVAMEKNHEIKMGGVWVQGSTNIKWPHQKSTMSYPLCIPTLISRHPGKCIKVNLVLWANISFHMSCTVQEF